MPSQQTNVIQETKVEDTYRLYTDDEKYKALITSHDGLSKDESNDLNRKIILLLLDKIEHSDLTDVLNPIKNHTT